MAIKSDAFLLVSPFDTPNPHLALAAVRAGALGVLDLGRDVEAARRALGHLTMESAAEFGVRLPEGSSFDPALLPANVTFAVLPSSANLKSWRKLRCFVQVTSLDEAKAAVAAGASALIAKGSESGGRVGEETAFVLLQRLRQHVSVPIWVQGGVGLYTAAACFAGGAAGVVLDSQLSLLQESDLPADLKHVIAAMDGSETAVVHGQRVLSRPGIPMPDVSAEGLLQRLGAASLQRNTVPAGADVSFAQPLAARFGNVQGLVRGMLSIVRQQLDGAARSSLLDEDSGFARDHNTRYSIAQGPMTRVSDSAAFAEAVTDAGGLPFLALALMRGPEVKKLLEEAALKLAGKPWGVGVLGFVPPELQEEQLDVIRRVRPPVALIAGGRPSQARPLEEAGIATYLHVPSPGLLDLYLKQGARRFVFEGQECGGHVGPRSSFVLWEAQMQRLMRFDRPEELSILFAGGIHDGLSAAMVSAIAAPLAERGARVGVLMGTAYLFTKELVESGALKPAFQEAAIGCETTVLLETAPGHATRCALTEYVQSFRVERQRLEASGASQQELWAALEELNLGRLRIAAKGLVRQDDAVLAVDEATQRREGMIMLGQIAALRHDVLSVKELHREVVQGSKEVLEQLRGEEPVRQRVTTGDIAIVGMAAILPGAPDLPAYWSNIVNGVNSIREVPAERWSTDVFLDPASTGGDMSPSKWGGFIEPVEFDPLTYGIPPRSLAAIEPTQLLALEASRRALADAGYLDREFNRATTSVIFGAEGGGDLTSAYGLRSMWRQYAGPLPPELDEVLPSLTEDSFPGMLGNVIAGRIANRLDLGGVNYTVDAACASSLAAVDLAVKELLSRSSDMVICGGADFHNGIGDYLMFASVHALSPTGHCSTFDAAADGISLGEGVTTIILKRLEDAERDGDRIYAVIKAVAGGSDGKSLGLTAPRQEGQVRTLERAYERAGISPSDVGLIEAHGTGTVVGDRTELETLNAVFREAGAEAQSCVLGSVKSQIGHTKCAAGVAGLIKAALSLYHRVLPPTLNVTQPNPGWDITSPFNINPVARPWPGSDRRAGVSAFGFGGTNFHAVLAEYDAGTPASGSDVWPSELFLFRGVDRAAALARVQALAGALSASASWRLRDLARTVSTATGPVQVACVASDIEDLRRKLETALQGKSDPGGVFFPDAALVGEPAKVAFVFPGQGSQRPGMLNDLLVTFPELQRYLTLGAQWLDVMFPPTAWSKEEQEAQKQNLTDTRNAQPALGIAGLAMAELLRNLGIKPDMLGGHSYGELVALAYAGVLSPAELLVASEARATAILNATADASDPGTMAAVVSDYDTVLKLIDGIDGVVIANANSPEQNVISGPTEAVKKAAEKLQAAGIRSTLIPVSCAFHSSLVSEAGTAFRKTLAGLEVLTPGIEVFSNTTAQLYALDADGIRDRLAEHIGKPVLFMREIEAMYEAGARIFIEAGPGRVMTGLISRILGDRPHVAVNCDQAGKHGVTQLLIALAQLAVNGVKVDAERLFTGRDAAIVDLAAPPVQKASSWWVNGQRAWPVQGELPDNAFKPITGPILTSGMAAAASTASATVSGRDAVVLEYLRNAREQAEIQNRIMMAYLGGDASALMAAMPAPAAPIEVPLSAPIESAPPAVEPIADPRDIEVSPVVIDIPDVATLLLQLVSERTGYPVEMLDLDLDLEADLSIDSIKRVEIVGALVERLGLRDADGSLDELPDDLIRLKTLRTILAALPVPAPRLIEPPAEPVVAEPSQAVIATRAAVDIPALLITLVSERTGYPAEMLDLDLDLEADLSIDSIKRVEVLGAAIEVIVGRSDGSIAELPDDLVRLKTLRGLAEALSNLSGAAVPAPAAVAAIEVVPAVRPAVSLPAAASITRYITTFTPTGGMAEVGRSLDGLRVAVLDDNAGLAEAVATEVDRLDGRARLADLNEILDPVDALIDLTSLDPSWTSDRVVVAFQRLREALMAGAGRIVIVTGTAPLLSGHVNGYASPPAAGMSGVGKTLAREWPDRVIRIVHLTPSQDVEHNARQICQELDSGEEDNEVAYFGKARRVPRIVRRDLEGYSDSAIELDSSSVLLVTGGARGITALIAREMAERFGCKIELVGRTHIEPDLDGAVLAGATDLASLRRALAAAGEKDMAVIDGKAHRILANREVAETIEGLRLAGSDVCYHAVDVRDAAAFGALIEDIYERHGRIDGVIHGAGVVEDKLAQDKAVDSFQRVFDTKVNSALVLARKLHKDVQFVAFFSSVAAVFGSRGQVDYAAANDFLDKLATDLNTRFDGRVFSINWGPWGGNGMVTPELLAAYSRRGISVIDPEMGVEAFFSELFEGPPEESQVILMSGELAALRRADQ